MSTEDEPQKAAIVENEAPDGVANFGSCCEELGEVVSGEEFEPLMYIGADGILYMSVGQIELEGEEKDFVQGMVDHPVFFCPFCGEELQSREMVETLTAADDVTTEQDGDDAPANSGGGSQVQ